MTETPLCDAASEQAFYALFDSYINLEKNTNIKYTAGEYCLERMRPLAALAGNPDTGLNIIHVAGTKGKGSTTFFLGALLASAGKRCGVFTSPHLRTVRERFQINNELVETKLLLAEAAKFDKQIRDAGMKPTFFEIITILALRLFRLGGCDWVVLESGIGGRLDCTNFVKDPRCTVITSISFDHTELLGCTLPEITREKAGIMKPGVPVVVAKQPFPETYALLARHASQARAPLVMVDVKRNLAEWPVSACPAFLRDNFCTALQVCEVCGIAPARGSYRQPRLPGRFEVLRKTPLVLIDSAHNADSAAVLVASLRDLYPHIRFTVVLGIVSGKDVAGIVAALRELDADFILTNPRPPKQSALEMLACEARRQNLNCTVIPLITSTFQLPSGRPILFTGSFFTSLIGDELFGEPQLDESPQQPPRPFPASA